MKVLVINCGSSSLKYQLIDSRSEEVLAAGLCERIGIDGRMTHTPSGGDTVVKNDPLPDHGAAIQAVLSALTDKAHHRDHCLWVKTDQHAHPLTLGKASRRKP